MSARADAELALQLMRNAASTFYANAVKTDCHAFIEFTGLMNEYITVCAGMTAARDYSWLTANTHNEVPLKMAEYQLKYLAEKLDCIYGPTVRKSEQLWRALKGQHD